MAELLPGADLDQLRRQAEELHRAAQAGEVSAVTRVRAVSDRSTLAAAQLALAQEHGFTSWARLETEVRRRQILDRLDPVPLRELLSELPELANDTLQGWCDHPRGAAPLGYVAMMRFDTVRGSWRDLRGTGALARELLRAGALVDGAPDDLETPLMTAASYGDAEVAQVLIEAGASLTATASPGAGGVPNGTALRHAAVFGMTHVADVLVTAGASDLVHAAATGSITAMLAEGAAETDRVAALRIAAEHGRSGVVDELLAARTPIDGVDRDGSTALHAAAYLGRSDSVRHLLALGADPARRDTRFGGTPLDWCRVGRPDEAGRGHDEVEELLVPVTPSSDG